MSPLVGRDKYKQATSEMGCCATDIFRDVLQSRNMPLIALASGSPRRRELLSLTGWDFTLCPVDIDESWLPGEKPLAYVSRLAQNKAQAAVRAYPGAADFYLAADTTVADGDTVLGKPLDAADARRMLRQLRGRRHDGFTALAVYSPAGGLWQYENCLSRVSMRAYTDEEIEAYIQSGDPMDKAGAYAIQNGSFHPVTNFSDCYANVMGLPLCHLVRLMRKFGVEPRTDAALSCQKYLHYDCPVSQSILAGPDILTGQDVG
jgi:septum formation protein